LPELHRHDIGRRFGDMDFLFGELRAHHLRKDKVRKTIYTESFRPRLRPKLVRRLLLSSFSFLREAERRSREIVKSFAKFHQFSLSEKI